MIRWASFLLKTICRLFAKQLMSMCHVQEGSRGPLMYDDHQTRPVSRLLQFLFSFLVSCLGRDPFAPAFPELALFCPMTSPCWLLSQASLPLLQVLLGASFTVCWTKLTFLPGILATGRTCASCGLGCLMAAAPLTP